MHFFPQLSENVLTNGLLALHQEVGAQWIRPNHHYAVSNMHTGQCIVQIAHKDHTPLNPKNRPSQDGHHFDSPDKPKLLFQNHLFLDFQERKNTEITQVEKGKEKEQQTERVKGKEREWR